MLISLVDRYNNKTKLDVYLLLMNRECGKKPSFDFFDETEDVITLVDNGQYIHFPVPQEVGSAEGIVLDVPGDISIFNAVHSYNRTNVKGWYNVGQIEAKFNDDVLMVAIASGEHNKHIDHDLDINFSFDTTHTMFRHTNKFCFDVQHKAVDYLKVTTVRIPIVSVTKLIGQTNTQFLLEMLNIIDSPSLSIVALPNRINNILNMAIAPHLTGGMKRLYAQAKVLEYLCELVSYFEQQQTKATQNNQQQSRSLGRDAYQLIIDQENQVSSLAELAQLMGVSTRKLNENFKAEFNMTAHQFLVNQRLNHAHKLLLENTMTQKQLAYQLGYSHVNHFITAFKRHFGYPPGHLQKAR